MAQSQVWIGLVQIRYVEPDPDEEYGGGAFTNALAWALSRKDYESKVTEELAELGFEVLAFEDVESWFRYSSKYEVKDDYAALAQRAADEECVEFGGFFFYPKEDEKE